MKNLLTIAIIVILSGFLSGCKAPDLSGKAVTIKGYNAINKVAIYDPMTGSYSPEILSIICNGMYSSVPVMGKDSCKFYSFFSEEHSSSVFNASATTYTCMSIFVTTDKALMTTYTQGIVDRLKSPRKKDDNKTDAETKAESATKKSEDTTAASSSGG